MRMARVLFFLFLGLIVPLGGARAACLLNVVDNQRLLKFAANFPVPPKGSAYIRYLGHSSFLIGSPGGATAVTDYNGLHVAGFPPDIVTMNNSHDSHYTDYPEPGIRHVLRGCSPGFGKGMAMHDVKVKDLRVFSIPTNIGEYGDPKGNGNSVFVFQIANLCIGHLGHLHHMLTRQQLLRLGRVDILFVPIDGGMTISHAEALNIIKQIEPKLVIPKHFGFMGVPDLFFEVAKEFWPIRSADGSDLVVTRKSLPRRTEVLFLQAGGPP